MISNPQWQSEMNKIMFSKKWRSNTLIIVEAVLLQDLITTIWRKSKHINYGSIIALTDNLMLVRQINNKITKSNWLA